MRRVVSRVRRSHYNNTNRRRIKPQPGTFRHETLNDMRQHRPRAPDARAFRRPMGRSVRQVSEPGLDSLAEEARIGRGQNAARIQTPYCCGRRAIAAAGPHPRRRACTGRGPESRSRCRREPARRYPPGHRSRTEGRRADSRHSRSSLGKYDDGACTLVVADRASVAGFDYRAARPRERRRSCKPFRAMREVFTCPC